MERLSISSFLANGREFDLYIYESVNNVPTRTRILDANEILPASRIFRYTENGSFAGFANLLRSPWTPQMRKPSSLH